MVGIAGAAGRYPKTIVPAKNAARPARHQEFGYQPITMELQRTYCGHTSLANKGQPLKHLPES